MAHVDDMSNWADKVDVCLNCGGSATDLAEQGPATVAFFNTVDSYDTHAKIPDYFASVDAAAKEPATSPSSPPAGTPACSPCSGSSVRLSCPTAPPRPSGARRLPGALGRDPPHPRCRGREAVHTAGAGDRRRRQGWR